MVKQIEDEGRTLGINIEFYDLKYIAGIFWEDQDGKWQGIIKENLSNGVYHIIRSEKVIMFLYDETLLKASAV